VDKVVDIVRVNFSEWAKYVQFRSSAADSVTQSDGDSSFAIFHAGRDLGKKDVSFCKVGETLADFTKRSLS
jgi:hypothetical protein